MKFEKTDIPPLLRQIPDPPKQLYIKGERELLQHQPALAVVGSRRPSPYGKAVTLELITAAARQGIVIISGLALGIDALAHKAALEAGGKTIAVLPCGVDKPYPATNRQLAQQILKQGGMLVTEYPDGTPPLHHHFIARNRLVSGLSGGVLITEAAEKSGTLHTAAFALDQGKTVMAVPGPITGDLSKGTNKLIKLGATPVTEPADIFEALGIGQQLTIDHALPANAEESAILKLLGQGVSETSELQLLSELEASIFNQTLTMLEISGKIRALGAGHWAVV